MNNNILANLNLRRFFMLIIFVLSFIIVTCSSDSKSSGTNSSSKEITSFVIDGEAGTITGTNISVLMPEGTSLTNLAPVIQTNGKSVSPASGVSQNFTSAVVYTVTAYDGSSQSYTVNVGHYKRKFTLEFSYGTYKPSYSNIYVIWAENTAQNFYYPIYICNRLIDGSLSGTALPYWKVNKYPENE